MLQETGVVESTDENFAYIKAARTATCDHCASKSMCQAPDGKEYVIVQAINNLGASEGDTVKFEVPSKAFFKASLMLYAIPLIALLIGSFVGRALYPKFSESMSLDGFSALCAFIFLTISIAVIKIISKGARDEQYMPKIVQVIHTKI